MNCELPPPVSKTTSEPWFKPETGLGGQVGQPALLFARDHLDVHAGARPDGGDDLVAVRGDAQAGRADGGDRPHAVPLGLVDHARDRGGRSLQRGVDDHALLREPFAEARHLRAVDDGAPAARPTSRSPMWNLIELVPASITA